MKSPIVGQTSQSSVFGSPRMVEIFIFILINEETVKSETGSKLRLLQQVDFELRVSNCRSGCKNGCTQRWERRDEIVIFMFSARAGNISLALIHFPPYLSALIPIDLPDRSERSDHRLSRSAPCHRHHRHHHHRHHRHHHYRHHLFLSRSWFTLTTGERVVGTIASRTIKIRAGHIDRGWPSSCNLCKYSISSSGPCWQRNSGG